MTDLRASGDLVRDSARAIAQVILVLGDTKDKLVDSDRLKLAQKCAEAETVLTDMLFANGVVSTLHDLDALIQSVVNELADATNAPQIVVPSSRLRRMN